MRNLRGYLPTLIFLLVVGFGLALRFTSQASLPDRAPEFPVENSVARFDRYGDELRFTLEGAARTYRIATDDPAVEEMLRASVRTRKDVKLTVTPFGAHFQPGGDVSLFWVEAIEYGGKKLGPFEARRAWSWRDLPEGDAVLLRAAALSAAGSHADALAALDGAMATDAADTGRERLAYDQRARALERQAYPPGHALNDADDRLLVRALADVRKAASLEEEPVTQRLNEARLLEKLGAYSEAIAIYEELRRDRPYRARDLAIDLSYAWRLMGKPEEALRALDELVEEKGPQKGMPFHYHRAQTLNLLGRHADAVRAIATGLESQSDYPWAFAERGCARARLGQIEEARADVLRARQGWVTYNTTNPADPGEAAYTRATFESTIATLDAAFERAPRTPVRIPCSADYNDKPTYKTRPRSALLADPPADRGT